MPFSVRLMFIATIAATYLLTTAYCAASDNYAPCRKYTGPSDNIMKNVAKIAQLKEIQGGNKEDPAAQFFQDFGLVNSPFRSNMDPVDLIATVSTYVVPATKAKKSHLKTVTKLVIKQNGDEIYEPIGNQYKNVVFRVGYKDDKYDLFDFKAMTSCQTVTEEYRNPWAYRTHAVTSVVLVAN